MTNASPTDLVIKPDSQRDLSPSTFVVTVHGIGPYDASHGAASRLIGELAPDLAATLVPVEFNWCSMVDAADDDSGKVRQLAKSIIEAAHISVDEQTGTIGRIIRAVGLLFEAVFKVSLLAIPLCVMLLIPAITTYVRFEAFGFLPTAATTAIHAIRLSWIVTAAVLVFALSLSALLRLITLRMLAASQLRRIVLTALQPVIPLVYRLANAKTRDALVSTAYFLLFYSLLAGVAYWLSPDAAAQWPGLRLRNLSIGAAAFVALYVAGLGISRVISAPTKLARDIFNYIGDARQHRLIQDALSSRVDGAIPRGAHVILVGHSLGSAIALDSLCNSDVWERFASISFVTCGSPIFRFFQRFFPGLYFPPDPAECISRIRAQAPVVRWLNVFRAGILRGDPVGQALFSRGGSGTDLPVRQRMRMLMQAHLDYWDDDDVIDAVRGAWTQGLPQSPRALASVSPEPLRNESLFDIAHDFAQRAAAIGAIGGFALFVANTFSVVNERKSVALDFVNRAAVKGVETLATVKHSTTYWGYGQYIHFPVQVYEFEFDDRNGARRRVVFREKEDSRVASGLYFDSAALRRVFGRKEIENEKKQFSVRILYLDDDERHLTLADPDLRPKPGGSAVFEVLWTEVGSNFLISVLLVGASFEATRRLVEAILPSSRSARS